MKKNSSVTEQSMSSVRRLQTLFHAHFRSMCTKPNKYQTSTNVDYDTYFQAYPSQINMSRTQYIRDKISKEYLQRNALGKQNYFEIGFGSGATVEQFGPYFNNLTLLEPNPHYIDELDSKLRQNKDVKQYRMIEECVDGESDISQYFSDAEREQGMDLIVASQCLWYIPPSSWDGILGKLYRLLSNDGGLLCITLTADESVSGSIYRCIEPQFQMANHVVRYFENHADYKKGKCCLSVLKEDYESEAAESDIVQQLLFYARTLVAPYPGHQAKEQRAFNRLYWDMVVRKFEEAGFYGQPDIVTYKSIQSHILVQKRK